MTLTVERDYEPGPTSPRPREPARSGSSIRKGGLPRTTLIPSRCLESTPPFHSYFVGTDGTLWVRRTGRGGTPRLDAFAADGTFLGEIDVPNDFDQVSIRYATNDHLYGVFHDEFDVPFADQVPYRAGVRHWPRQPRAI